MFESRLPPKCLNCSKTSIEECGSNRLSENGMEKLLFICENCDTVFTQSEVVQLRKNREREIAKSVSGPNTSNDVPVHSDISTDQR